MVEGKKKQGRGGNRKKKETRDAFKNYLKTCTTKGQNEYLKRECKKRVKKKKGIKGHFKKTFKKRTKWRFKKAFKKKNKMAL